MIRSLILPMARMLASNVAMLGDDSVGSLIIVEVPALGYSDPDLGSDVIVTTGEWGGDPTLFLYQWQRNGVPIAGATGETYTLVSADNNASIRCVVTASNEDGSKPAYSDVLTAEFTPVSTRAITIEQGGGYQVLVTQAALFSYATGGVALQWFRNGVLVVGQTGTQYNGPGGQGDEIVARAIGLNITKSAHVDSSPVELVAPAPGVPVNSVAPALGYTTSGPGSTITCSTGTWSDSPTSFTRQWKRNGVNISGQTGGSYVLVDADNNAAITCVVTASNVSGPGVATASNSLTPEYVPVNTRSIVVEESEGRVVVIVQTPVWKYATTGVAYRWYLNSVLVVGQTGEIYEGPGNAGDWIYVISEAVNGAKHQTSQSNTVELSELLEDPPVNTVAPSFATPLAVGIEAAGNGGTWIGDGIGFDYQWLKDGENISGATSLNYTPLDEDFEHTLMLTVQASNGGGFTQAQSPEFDVAYKVPVNIAAPALSFFEGVFSVSAGEWEGNVVSFTRQWYLNGSPVSGETASTYAGSGSLVLSDVLYCIVKAVNPSAPSGIAEESNHITFVPPVYVMVYWNDNSDNETGFRIEWGTDGTTFPNSIEAAADASSYNIPFPGAGTYYARVVAFNSGGDAAPSNVLTIAAS